MNKIFKKTGIFLTLILIVSSSFSQSIYEKYNLNSTDKKQIEAAVDLYWKWDDDAEPIKAVRDLRQIADENSSNWLAPFWASYISTQLANANNNSIEYLNDAQSYLDQCEKAFMDSYDSTDVAYIQGLQALVHTLSSFYFMRTGDQPEFEERSKKAKEFLNMAVKSDPFNPIVMVFTGTQLGRDVRTNIYNVLGALALLEKAKSDLVMRTRQGSADPAFINQHWIEPWLKNLRPPSE